MPSQPTRPTRAQDSREANARPAWKPLDQYPIPVADGKRFRWLRTQEVGQSGVTDTRNISRRFREGWVPSRADNYPELLMKSDERSPFPEGIDVSGMLLCEIGQPIVDARNDYYRNQADQQMQSVDNSMFRVNDNRGHGMQILPPSRKTRVARGKRADSDVAED